MMALQVIGAGFGRTGTASTKIALEMLGVGPCYHMIEVLAKPERIGQWIEVGAGRPDWEAIFAGYRATVDFPASPYWRELARHWPQAKVLLNWRDPESWYASTQETIMGPDFSAHIAPSPFGAMARATWWKVFDGRIHERDHLLAVYNAHVEAVRAEVPADRLLVFEAKDGWEPLCRFLGVPVPDAPFPRVNSRDETRAILERMMAGEGNSAGDPMPDLAATYRGDAGPAVG